MKPSLRRSATRSPLGGPPLRYWSLSKSTCRSCRAALNTELTPRHRGRQIHRPESASVASSASAESDSFSAAQASTRSQRPARAPPCGLQARTDLFPLLDRKHLPTLLLGPLTPRPACASLHQPPCHYVICSRRSLPRQRASHIALPDTMHLAQAGRQGSQRARGEQGAREARASEGRKYRERTAVPGPSQLKSGPGPAARSRSGSSSPYP